nr:Multidrug resistance protein ABC transporter family protein, putative [Ipomoea batatas]GME09860.1 Multidrug resistance protein ABC transporter family protein, putative [Ipomoea batatas]GME09863.1 Multidrug resistance protein ABC transporter family protein, putative [Ipomoea batatas]GME18304.1 Multidrug resistance protein ABC transporter family protein, putative [Ipomoea batatas]
MGNSMAAHGGAGKVKVILADGRVCEYVEPLTAAEMMLEHPQQVVVEFQAVAEGKKAAPLPADRKLEMNKVYLMLPIRRGKPAALSKEEARQLLGKTDAVLKSKLLSSSSSVLCHYTGFVPLFARMCPAASSGGGVVLNAKRNIGILYLGENEEEEEEGSKADYFSEIVEGRPEYLNMMMSRQLSGKGWKPNLDTIKEKNIKTKVRHWLF